MIATYNGAAHIGEQLDSVARQTVPPDEIVVGDDGSSDATLSIVRDFAARTSIPVTIAEKSERLGFADNFLWTAEQSRYELIALCDQDDRWLSDKLERARDRIVRDDSLLAMHTLTIADAALTPTGEVWRQGIEGDGVFEPLQLDPYVTGWGNSMLFRRELLDLFPREARPRQPEATYRPLSHDTWIYVLAAALGRVSHIAEPLLLYRQHESNATGLKLSRFWRLRRVKEMAVVPLERLRAQAAFHGDMARLFGQLAAENGAFAALAKNAAVVFDGRAALSSARALTFDAPTAIERLRAYRTARRLRRPASDSALSRIKALTMGVAGLSRELPFLVQQPQSGQRSATS